MGISVKISFIRVILVLLCRDVFVSSLSAKIKPQMSVLLTLSVNLSDIALGLRPQTPMEAPPLAGFNMKSPVAYYHSYHTRTVR